MKYTVEELIKALQKCNPNSIVWIDGNGAATEQIVIKQEDSYMRLYICME